MKWKIKLTFKGKFIHFFLFHHWVRIRQKKTSLNRRFSPKRPEVGQIFILRSKFGQNKDHMASSKCGDLSAQGTTRRRWEFRLLRLTKCAWKNPRSKTLTPVIFLVVSPYQKNLSMVSVCWSKHKVRHTSLTLLPQDLNQITNQTWCATPLARQRNLEWTGSQTYGAWYFDSVGVLIISTTAGDVYLADSAAILTRREPSTPRLLPWCIWFPPHATSTQVPRVHVQVHWGDSRGVLGHGRVQLQSESTLLRSRPSKPPQL